MKNINKVEYKEIDHFDNIKSFVKNLIETYKVQSYDYPVTPINVVADCKIIIDLVNILIKTTKELELYYCDTIESPDYSGDCYTDFILSIDPENHIWVERAYKNGTYLFLDDEDSINFVHYNSVGIIEKNKDKDIILFGIDSYDKSGHKNEDKKTNNEENIVSESKNVTVSRDKSGTPLGFTLHLSDNKDGFFCSSSYSYFCDIEDELRRMAKKFNIQI